MSHIHEELNIRIVHIHLEDFAPLEYRRSYLSAYVRRLHREVLVSPLGVHLEGFDSPLFDGLHHVFHRRLAYVLHGAFAFHGGAYGCHSEDLAYLLKDCLLPLRSRIELFVRPDKDKSLVSVGLHSVEFLEKLFDAVKKHSLEVWLVHTLQCHLTASHYENVLPIVYCVVWIVCHYLKLRYLKLPSRRNLFTAAVTFSITVSASSSVLNLPRLNLIVPSISLSLRPIAFSTWL